ncbi:hypothetical protein O1611_g3440 [Lasiodiplodia mahajangana]|uniref:Uncharacterized protein n=1 Tax=Lasiodiplodia mahajangana TaxID=1108764 RepID=A0ACC2JRS9_9PEZI|nr:hypothetical protein O1611_g3440 [Lasiodiplodia mahajangana]
MASQRLSGKVAIITGSSSGLGRAIALAYSEEGAHIVCADLRPEARADVESELSVATHDLIKKNGRRAIYVQTDVSVSDDVKRLAEKAVEEYGRIDVLVNNAGISLEAGRPPMKIHETPEDMWDKTMAVNVKSVYLASKFVIEQMLKQDLYPSGDRGWIINISSVLGLVGGRAVSSYCASKGAVSILTRQVALDYADVGIHCNAICPGYTRTAIFVNTIKHNDDKELAALHPLHGIGSPRDLIGAAIFLASNESRCRYGLQRAMALSVLTFDIVEYAYDAPHVLENVQETDTTGETGDGVESHDPIDESFLLFLPRGPRDEGTGSSCLNPAESLRCLDLDAEANLDPGYIAYAPVATAATLKALLALPTALRPVLLGAFAPSRQSWTQCRLFSASSLNRGAVKYPNVAALLIPEFRNSSIAEITPDDLFKTSSLSSAPGQPLEDELTKLYTKNPAAFVYAESDFYKLKKNTRTPEVCILGRSNAGKSSFVNALAQRPNNGLAFVSSKAGKTRSINTYGFGPAPTAKELQAQGSEYKDEDIPTHMFYLVDMPGYGHASLKEWGKNISLYLNKRSAVKGAIVLIDAEVGPKDSDIHLLQLLSAAQLKTAVVLTKADKVKKGLEGLRTTCKKVWDILHNLETRTMDGNWTWEKDVYVTAVGARDSSVVSSTVTTARLAVARLAGLIKDERPNAERNKRWSGKMISFDDLQFAPSKSALPETSSSTAKPTQVAWETPFPSKKAPAPSKTKDAFADLDHAAKAQNSHRSRISTGFGTRNWARTGRTHARAFYSTSAQGSEQSRGLPRGPELDAIIDEFMKTLKAKADTQRDQLRRLQQERKRNPPKFFKKSFKQLEEHQIRRLQKRFPAQTLRAQAIFDRRIDIEARRHQKKTEAKKAMSEEWPAADDVTRHSDVNKVMDPDEFERVFATTSELHDEKKDKTNTSKRS